MPSLYEYATDWSTKALKKEYTRLRDQFVKQIQRLGEAKPEDKKAQLYGKEGKKYPKKISVIESLPYRKTMTEKEIRNDWAVRVAELEQLTKAPSLSLAGRRKTRRKIIKSLNAAGYKSINNKNFDDFYDFMNFIMDRYKEYYKTEYAEDFANWLAGGVVSDPKLKEYIDDWKKNKKDHVDIFR